MKTISISKWVALPALLFTTFAASAQVNFNIGNLAPGEKVIVTFDTTINAGVPANIYSVSNQATLTAAAGVNLNSDDRATALPNDPTVTPLTVAPQITVCPPDLTTNTATGLCNRPVPFAAVAVGGSTPPVVTYKLGAVNIASPYSFEPGTNVVTVTASNGVLPNATCSFTIIVKDQEAPTMLCPVDIVTNVIGSCPAVVAFATASFATDPCGLTNLTATPPSGSSFPIGTNLVTIAARDTSGNSNGCVFKVIVNSTPVPPATLGLLRQGTNTVLSWSNVYSCYQLEFLTNFAAAPATNVWTPYPGPFYFIGGNIYITNPIGKTNRLFRLKL